MRHAKTLPWRIDPQESRKILSDNIHGFDPLRGENVIGGSSIHFDADVHAAMMVIAVNNTYGKGIDPKYVPNLLEMVNELLAWAESIEGTQVSCNITKTHNSIFSEARAYIEKAKY